MSRFSFASRVFPRYGAEGSSPELVQPSGSSESSHLTPTYKLSFKADVLMPTRIVGVHSPSHKLDVREAGDDFRRRIVTLSELEHMDRDLIVNIQLEEAPGPRAIVEFDEERGTHAALVSFVPNLSRTGSSLADDLRYEMIIIVRFVVTFGLTELPGVVCELTLREQADRSGSMMGPAIASERQALRAFLTELMRGCAQCTFNIVSFGSRYEALFGDDSCISAVPVSEANIEKALAAVDGFEADMGGTELLSAFSTLQKCSPEEGFVRQVLLLTDGGVSNTDDVVAAVAATADTTRVFTFGFGDSVSRALVTSVAEAGNGEAEFATAGEDLVKQVRRQVRRAMQPALRDLKLEWSNDGENGSAPELEVERAPQKAKPVFDGEQYEVAVLFSSARQSVDDAESSTTDTEDETESLSTPALGHISLSGVLPNGNVERWSVQLDEAPTVTGSSVHKMVPRSPRSSG